MNKMLFGKAIEYKVASEMLREGFEIYLPAVDDHGVDLMARTPRGNIVEVQVKSLSKSAKGGLFSPIKHTPTSNFYFVSYLESQDSMWIFNSADFLKYATVNKSGKNIGQYSIDVLKKACSPFRVTDYSTIV